MSGSAGRKETLAWCFYRNPRHPYDGFMANYLFKPLKYAFVHKHYDRLLAEFVRELPELGHHFSTVHGAGGEVWLADTIKQMETTGVYSLYSLLERVRTRSQAQGFLAESGVAQPSLMEWLDYLKQWWFPYPATLRQLVEDDGDPLLHTALVKLKGAKIANSSRCWKRRLKHLGGTTWLAERVSARFACWTWCIERMSRAYRTPVAARSSGCGRWGIAAWRLFA